MAGRPSGPFDSLLREFWNHRQFRYDDQYRAMVEGTVACIARSRELLDRCRVPSAASSVDGIAWQPISTVLSNQDVELAVIEDGEAVALIFPCRRANGGWVGARTGERADVSPTHWRAWKG